MAKKKNIEIPQGDEHTVPGPLSPEAMNWASSKKTDPEEQNIAEYVELETDDERVVYLEKITSERLFGRRIDAWSVHTDKNRYWVITEPTNLYSQELFPSLDYTFSFHVGVTTRVMAKREVPVSEEQEDRLAGAWRRWRQAAEALDEADEAEEFQAVGMRCRECLIALIRTVAVSIVIPEGQERPKASDFLHWSELIANDIAKGTSNEEIRGYLKAIAKSTWQLVNWLTHASTATKFDGIFAVDATENVLSTYGMALFRHEKGIPDRCPKCSSYKVSPVYHSDLDLYITTCESCGWLDVLEDTNSSNK